MGLFGRRRIKDPVPGQARILEMGPTPKAARQTEKRDIEYRFRLEVTTPGHQPYEVEHEQRVPHAKTPVLGDTLAIEVSRTDPSQLAIDWDQAPNLAERFES